MWCFLCFCLFLATINCDESKNETIILLNDTNKIEPGAKNSTNSNGAQEFRPSPPFQPIYEYNKVPVPPAMPEAKFYNWGEFAPIDESTWSSRVKFPTAKERPYQFFSDDKSANVGKSYLYPSKADGYLSKPPPDDTWKQFFENEKKKQLIQKHQFDFGAPVEKPIDHEQKIEISSVEKPHHEIQANPWKKIIKFLTAFIPIGLLISALTPTVITVTAVNGTSRVAKSEDSKRDSIASSLNYWNNLNAIGCEDRILCELLLSATSTQSAEHHVENLLNTFTENGRVVEKADEMRKIFDAVKKQDCRPIICRNIKENT